jgi:hypothetical protein
MVAHANNSQSSLGQALSRQSMVAGERRRAVALPFRAAAPRPGKEGSDVTHNVGLIQRQWQGALIKRSHPPP